MNGGRREHGTEGGRAEAAGESRPGPPRAAAHYVLLQGKVLEGHADP